MNNKTWHELQTVYYAEEDYVEKIMYECPICGNTFEEPFCQCPACGTSLQKKKRDKVVLLESFAIYEELIARLNEKAIGKKDLINILYIPDDYYPLKLIYWGEPL